MKILYVKRGFNADHSSSSYEFISLEQKKNETQRDDIDNVNLTSEDKIYLLRHYYDACYQEYYGIYILSIGLTVNLKEKRELQRYEFSGFYDYGSVGIDVETFRDQKDRVIVNISVPIFEDAIWDLGIDNQSNIDSDDPLLLLLARIHNELKNHIYDSLYAVVEKYGTDDDLDCVTEPKDLDSETLNIMRSLLDI